MDKQLTQRSFAKPGRSLPNVLGEKYLRRENRREAWVCGLVVMGDMLCATAGGKRGCGEKLPRFRVGKLSKNSKVLI